MNLGELVVQLGVKADTFTVRDFSKAIGDIPFSVASAITSLTGLSVGFAEMTKNVLNMTTGFEVFTAETGMNARALEQWQQVAQRAGLSGDIVTSSVNSLTSLMSQLRLGHGLPPAAAQAFGMLGFSPNDYRLNGLDMLSKIQKGVAGKDPTIATDLLKALGVSPEMMRVFQTPAAERERLQPIMSQGAIEQMAGFQKELATFNQTVMGEFVKVLVEIEPYMRDLTAVLVDLVHIAGKGAGGMLGLIHDVREGKKHGVGLFSGDAIPAGYDMDRTTGEIVKISTNVTQHIHSTSDPEAVGREAAHHVTRAQNRKAASDVANRGR